jgi:hypothetical protein
MPPKKPKKAKPTREPETDEALALRLSAGSPLVERMLLSSLRTKNAAKKPSRRRLPVPNRFKGRTPLRQGKPPSSELAAFPPALVDAPRKPTPKYGNKKAVVVGTSNPYAHMETAQADALKQAEQDAAERATKSRRRR